MRLALGEWGRNFAEASKLAFWKRKVPRNDSDPSLPLRDFRKKLNIVLLQQMPKRSIGNLEQLGSADLYASGLLQG